MLAIVVVVSVLRVIASLKANDATNMEDLDIRVIDTNQKNCKKNF